MNSPSDIVDDLRLLQEPIPLWQQPWFVATALTLVIFAVFFYWVRHRRLRAFDGAQARVAETAHEDALAELQRLFALVEAEQSRPYAIESSGIVRRYIERRFGIRAPLRSTEEFLREAQHSPKLAAEHQSLLGEFLGCCDFLKFVRGGAASREELEKLHRTAVDFVTATRLRVEPEAVHS
jgi:hypothetical protein